MTPQAGISFTEAAKSDTDHMQPSAKAILFTAPCRVIWHTCSGRRCGRVASPRNRLFLFQFILSPRSYGWICSALSVKSASEKQELQGEAACNGGLLRVTQSNSILRYSVTFISMCLPKIKITMHLFDRYSRHQHRVLQHAKSQPPSTRGKVLWRPSTHLHSSIHIPYIYAASLSVCDGPPHLAYSNQASRQSELSVIAS